MMTFHLSRRRKFDSRPYFDSLLVPAGVGHRLRLKAGLQRLIRLLITLARASSSCREAPLTSCYTAILYVSLEMQVGTFKPQAARFFKIFGTRRATELAWECVGSER